MPLTHEEALAKRRAEAPSREEFLARFHDDGHTARIVFQDNGPPMLRVICPHTGRLRENMSTTPMEVWDPGCDNKVCWVGDWYNDIAWEAMEVATYPEDGLDAKWPQWMPTTGTLRFLYRWNGSGEDAEFWFTLDDLVEPTQGMRLVINLPDVTTHDGTEVTFGKDAIMVVLPTRDFTSDGERARWDAAVGKAMVQVRDEMGWPSA